MRISITTVVTWLICCSCAETGPGSPIGEGYAVVVRGAVTVLHVPGNAELWHSANGRNVLVWHYLSGESIATNGFCVFNGGLGDEGEWQSYPALLVHCPPGPVVELTELLTRRYCEMNAKPYESARGKYIFRQPAFTNGTFLLEGFKRPSGTEKNEWIDLALSTKELIEIIESVKKTGVKRKYRGIEYRIADPVEPSNAKEN